MGTLFSIRQLYNNNQFYKSIIEFFEEFKMKKLYYF